MLALPVIKFLSALIAVEVLEDRALRRHGIGCEVLFSLRAFAIGNGSAIGRNLTHLWAFTCVALLSVQQVLHVEHREQNVAQIDD